MPRPKYGTLLHPRKEGETVGYTSEGRPIIRNADGTVSTEQTITVEHPEGYINIPTMYKGKKVSDEEALDIITKSGGIDPDTGRKLSTHKTLEEAVAEAKKRSKKLDEEMKKILRESR